MIPQRPREKTYDGPAVWAPLLVKWATQGRDHYLAAAEAQRKLGHKSNAAAYVAKAGEFVWIADYGRARLVDISDLSADDAEQLAAIQVKTDNLVAAGVLLPDDDEPPKPLVDLTAWLRGRLGGRMWWVSAEVWQTVGMLLLRGRP